MSHPRTGTILAPRARWTASSGEVRVVTSGERTGPPRAQVPAAECAGAASAGAGVDVGLDRAEVVDGGVELALEAVEGDQVEVEHALAVEAVDDLDHLRVVADQHGRRAGDDEPGRGDVLAQVGAEVGEGVTDRLELDARVEHGLDQLQLEQVAVGVLAARAAALGVGQRGPHQVGAGPVVELPVRDAHDLGRCLAAEAVVHVVLHPWVAWSSHVGHGSHPRSYVAVGRPTYDDRRAGSMPGRLRRRSRRGSPSR